MLIGREHELGRVSTLLEEARRGRSGTLVVVGEPGIGKTALLGEVRQGAAGMRVLAVTGAESESELPFAALHGLLLPVLDEVPKIPELQARALSAALALESGETSTLAVRAGALSVLVQAAEAGPLLVVVDDAHWLDHESAEAIAFAARRLVGDEIAILVALRPGMSTVFESLPTLELRPLPAADAKRLIEIRATPVPPATVSRLLAVAEGNPLALLELPLELIDELPRETATQERLQRAFSHRVDALDEPARLGLVLAAAEPDVTAVRRAAERLALGDPLAEATEAGLVRAGDGRVEFRHPLIRSLVYAGATEANRRRAHAALGEVLTDERDQDRRAWHVAAATEGRDEQVARLLEETAERALARGGHAAQARALERAARLSPENGDVARRLYAASRAAFWAGDASYSRTLAEEALPLASDPLLHADILQQMGSVGEWQGVGISEAAYLKELESVDGLDQERAARMLYQVVKLRLDAFDADGALELAPRLEAAARGAGPFWQPRTLAGAAAAYLVAGRREEASALLTELAGYSAMPVGFAFDFVAAERYDEVRTSLELTLSEGRASGHQLRIAYNQSVAAYLELRLGRLDAAAAAAAEAIPLGEAIGTTTLVGIASGALAGVAAWRGREDACRSRAGTAVQAARDAGDRFQESVGRHALALLDLGAGRPHEVIAELEPLARAWQRSSVVEPSFVPFVPDLVEACIQAGDAGAARAWLDPFTRSAEKAQREWALAASARCEGLLAPAADLDEPFRRALAILDPSPLALERARTQLAYGERLRRERRPRDARALLRAAHDAFVAVGAVPWQERAAAGLRATGERVAGGGEPAVDLTPQELHISLLVAEGKTNKEIAAALFLSPKTVDYHLGNVFRKLSIHSRAELARIVTRDGAAQLDSHD